MPTSEYINDRKVCREGTTLTYGDSLPSDTLRTLLYNSSVASSPHCHWLVYSEVPTFRNINWQSVDDAFFPICSFLAHRQVVTRSNQLFAQIFSRHNERWACMLCGVTPSNCFFDLLVLVIILFFGQWVPAVSRWEVIGGLLTQDDAVAKLLFEIESLGSNLCHPQFEGLCLRGRDGLDDTEELLDGSC